MKLNLHIIYDEIKTPGRRILAGDGIALDLHGVRSLPDDSRQLSPNYVYVTSAENLRQHEGIKPGTNLLCIGDMDEGFLRARGWQAIVLKNGPGEHAAFERVQDIFDQYRSWNDELTAAILQQEPLQTVLDIGTRYLCNPVAPF